ncbi:MAG: NAD(P)/FAD-dependent oxidoreductase [Gemmatimonadaceae bacterium]
MQLYDVAIVGGGPAGLSAGLWLGRYLHRTVVIDSGDPRNWETRGINGFLGQPTVRPPELRGLGREECRRYGVELMDARVDGARRVTEDALELTLAGGARVRARRLLLAIGLRDVWPEIPGLKDCYGSTAHVCPDCDGFDARGRNTVVIGTGRRAVGMALNLLTWTSSIVICTNGEEPAMDDDLVALLDENEIPVLTPRITCLRTTDGELRCAEFEGGMQLDAEKIFLALGQYPADDLGAQLGCERDDDGHIVVDDRHHTSVPDVYAAGDIIPGPQLAIAAAADGAIAALAIHKSLVPDSRKLPPLTTSVA